MPNPGRKMAPQALAFDVYGTLIDTASVAEALPGRLPDRAALARAWRRHQLEITWLVSLMERFEGFDAVTAYALDAALAEAGLELSAGERGAALEGYATLPAYSEAAAALERLERAGLRLVVLSNGARGTLETMLAAAGLRERFADVISADEVRTFKPSPAVYRHAAERLGLPLEEVWLVSGNPFDCAGAKNAGLGVARVERGPSFAYGFAAPADVVVSSLTELAEVLA